VSTVQPLKSCSTCSQKMSFRANGDEKSRWQLRRENVVDTVCMFVGEFVADAGVTGDDTCESV